MTEHLIKLRKWWTLICITAIAAAAFFNIPATFCIVNIGWLQLVCPVGFIETSIATKSIMVKMLPGTALVGILTLFLGRSFCSWVCPARYTGKVFKNFADNKMHPIAVKTASAWKNLRTKVQTYVKLTAWDGLALLAGLFIGILIFGFPAYSIFCPVGVLSRNLIEFTTHSCLRFDLVLLIIPLVMGLAFETGWKCACPMGLVRAVAATSNKTLLPVINHENCINCGACMKNCAFGVNLHAEKLDTFSCSKCLNCIRDCNRDAIDLKILN